MAENLPLTPYMEQYYIDTLRSSTVGEVRLAADLEQKYCSTQDPSVAATHHHAPPLPSQPDTQTTPPQQSQSQAHTKMTPPQQSVKSPTCVNVTISHPDDSTHSVYHLSYTITGVCLLLLCDTTLPTFTLVCLLLLLTTNQLLIVHSTPTHSTPIWSSYCLSSSLLLTSPSSHTYLIQTSPTISSCTTDYPPVSNYILSVPISLLFQPHPTRHVSHPSISYCDHTP